MSVTVATQNSISQTRRFSNTKSLNSQPRVPDDIYEVAKIYYYQNDLYALIMMSFAVRVMMVCGAIRRKCAVVPVNSESVWDEIPLRLRHMALDRLK